MRYHIVKRLHCAFEKIEFHARNMTSCPGYPYCLWPIETVLKLAVWAHSGSVKQGINGSRLHIYSRHLRCLFSKVRCNSSVMGYRMPLSASKSPRGVFGCTSPNISRTYGNRIFFKSQHTDWLLSIDLLLSFDLQPSFDLWQLSFDLSFDHLRGLCALF